MRWFAFLLLTGFAVPASAWCPSVGVKAEFHRSDIVLTGKVISKRRVKDSQVPNGWYGGTNYTVHVSKIYRGHPGQTATIFSENTSGRVPMSVGSRWLVFAVALKGTFGGKTAYQIDCGGNSGVLSGKRKALSLVQTLANQDKPGGQQKQQIDKISVLANGKLFLNGKPTTLAALNHTFSTLAREHGMVWYYRQNAQATAPPDAMDVIKLVIKYRLPISLSSKSDFSDYVGPEGGSHPRTPQ